MAYNSTRRPKHSNLPPGPRNRPVIGAILEMSLRYTWLLESWLRSTYWPIVYLKLCVQPIVVVSSTQVAEELLKHKDTHFADRFAMMTTAAHKHCGLDGGGLLWGEYDAEHILRRKIIVTEFFTVAKFKTYEELRRQEIDVMVEKVLTTIESTNKSNVLRNGNRGVTVGIKDMFAATSLNVIFALVMGERLIGYRKQTIFENSPKLWKINAVDVLPFLTWLDPQDLLKKYEAFGKRIEHFMRRLSMAAGDREVHRGGKMLADAEVTERNFVDVLLDFQEEGAHASLASGLCWSLHAIRRCCKDKAEVDGVVGMDRPVDETDIQLQNIPFLNAVVTEAVRLYFVVLVSFAHTNKETTTLAGYTIPPNRAVLLNIPSNNRDPKVWKDLLQFNLERFMGDEGEKIKANGTHYSLLTFGGGRRGCAGFNLAWVLFLRATATLVLAFGWSPPPGLSPNDISAGEEGRTVFLKPVVDLNFTPKPRALCNLYHSKTETCSSQTQ